jgi:hypothetical protein
LNPADHSALIGVSLDSQSFTRDWVKFALSYTLSKNKDVELFLGDRLLLYNKTVQDSGPESSVDFHLANTRREKRKQDVTLFLQSEIKPLPIGDQRRIKITSWADYSDVLFEDIARNLHICYTALPAFRNCVDLDVDVHFESNPHSTRPKAHRFLSSLYVVEETAMIIRITELADKPFFYYPAGDINTLRSLYDDEFSGHGLSVENLTGKPKSRVFTALPLPVSVTEPKALE